MSFGDPSSGKRVMALVIDDLAHVDPNRKVCSMPESPGNPQVYVELSVKQLAHAINYMSWWILKEFGKGDSVNETLAYFGSNDVHYLVMVVACNKTGYKVCVQCQIIFLVARNWTSLLIYISL